MHGHNSLNLQLKLLALLRLIYTINIHRRSHTAHGSSFGNKIWEFQLKKSLLSLQMLLQMVQNAFNLGQAHRAQLTHAFHKAAHMRTAHIMGQIHCQEHLGHAVLGAALPIAQLDGPAQILNTHVFKRNAAQILFTLYVLQLIHLDIRSRWCESPTPLPRKGDSGRS